MGVQTRDSIDYFESKEDYEGQLEGLLPPSKRPVPRGPVCTPIDVLDAAIARAYARQSENAASRGGANVIAISAARGYNCRVCGQPGHNSRQHRQPVDLD